MQVISRKEAKEQGLKYYFTGKPCKNGHVALRYTAGRCVDCCAEWSVAHEARRRERRAVDPSFDEAMKARQRRAGARFTERHPERRKQFAANWLAIPENKERRYQRNLELKRTARHRAVSNRRVRERRATEPTFAIAQRLRARMHTALNAAMAQKHSGSLSLLGCDWEQLIGHLEAQFADGMSLENYAEWHVDHIRPCASFDLEDPAQQRACFFWANLQPLWATDNLAKSDEWTPEMEAEWAQMMRDAGFEGELFLVFS